MQPKIIRQVFDQFDPKTLYSLLRLRQVVFVVEQCCVFVDADNLDQEAEHFYICHQNQIIAALRVIPPGIAHKNWSIGRIVVDQEHRNRGLATSLIRFAMKEIHRQYPKAPIHMGAQSRLKEYYQKFGFTSSGHDYLEDGIPHTEMIWAPA